ncbi:kynureninase [Sphingosinicella sp.]|uniref:kynureninase n=1 Tax=Sphingosinicella sp. TaxID=1917971 RepID=UPI00403798AD
MSVTLADAEARDAADPLLNLRGRFDLPEGVIYLDGNSLGPLPKGVAERVAAVVSEEWGGDLIRGWNARDWIGAPQRVGAMIAPLIGAKPHEVIVADSTTVNLFKLVTAAAALAPERSVILTEAGNFRTDLYVAEGAANLLGRRFEARARDEVEGAIGPGTSLLLLTHVHYRTGARFDMAGLTARARDTGALTLWDLSHSAGAVPLDLGRDGVELAVGCGYKYLNGGPGAPAFLYVAEHLQERLMPALRGWMGHEAPFAFDDDYRPAPGLDRFLVGTPPILGIAALEAALDAYRGVAMDAVWAKSVALFDLFRALMAERCPDFTCITPQEPELRGSHISFAHPHAFEICQALIAEGVIGDFRSPDVLRLGLTPLYLGFADIWRAVDILGDIMGEARWRDPAFAVRGKVT